MRHIGRVLVPLVAALLSGAILAGAPASGESAPDPVYTFRAVTVPALDGVLALEEHTYYDGPTTVWRFDLTTAAWQRFALAPSSLEGLGFLLGLPDGTAVLSIPLSSGGVGVLDLASRQWQTRPTPRPRPASVTDAVVDGRRGLAVAWSDWDDQLWTYDPRANRWDRVEETKPWPTSAYGNGDGGGYTLMAYDSSTDRVVLAVLPIPGGRTGSTWLYDVARRRWTRTASSPPEMNFGYGEWSTSAVYDPVHQRIVLFSYGAVATYDSARDRWAVPARDGWAGMTRRPDGLYVGPLVRLDHQLVADSTRGRILVLGGSALVHQHGVREPYDYSWHPVHDVWAYDVGFNSWTRLTGR